MVCARNTYGTNTYRYSFRRQGLAGLWGQDTDKMSTFLVFLTSHFMPAALSSDLNQPETIYHDKKTTGIMKTRPGAIKEHEKPPGTMKNRPATIKTNLEP